MMIVYYLKQIMHSTHTPTNSSTPVTSPCNNECALDSRDICTGCFRTIQEIIGWAQKSESEQLVIVENCAERIKCDNR